MDAPARDAYLAFLCDLSVTLDDGTARQAWAASAMLAERHGSTVYDAAYLELALRRDLPLTTLDEALRTAAEQAGAVVLPRVEGDERRGVG
jgi:predicted nucleic acid-binding protein